MSNDKKTSINRFPNYYRDERSGIIHFRKRINGHYIQFSTKETTVNKAVDFVNKKLKSLRLSKSSNTKLPNASIERLWGEVIESKIASGKTPQTVEKYHMNWRVIFSKYFKDLYALDIDQEQVIKFENWYLENFPKRNYFNTKKHLRVLIKHMQKQGYPVGEIVYNDLDKIIDRNTRKEKVGRIYTKDEINSLLATKNMKARFAINIYVHTGLRKNELLELEKSAFSEIKKHIKVWMPKTGKYKIIPLPTFLVKEFKGFIKKHSGKKYLFESKDRSGVTVPMRPQLMDKMWKEAKLEAGIERALEKNKARIHDLRHTCATRFAEKGMPIATACAILGMSLSEYEKTYLKVTEESKKEWIERVYE